LLLIRHSKYSAILSRITPTDCFFGDFAYWDERNDEIPFFYPHTYGPHHLSIVEESTCSPTSLAKNTRTAADVNKNL